MGTSEIFSFHLLTLPLSEVPTFFLSPLHRRGLEGLLHSESLLTMNLGDPVVSPSRYGLTKLALFAWWRDESSLENFAKTLRPGDWHVRLKLYRRWGKISEIQDAIVDPSLARPDRPVVAVTLARLDLFETARFTRWGKPVERQVRDHAGKNLALAAIRPLNTFCTFSIWRNEAEMISMVRGKDQSHSLAMQERERKDFHHEFTTMRFVPIGEFGSWNGKSNYTSAEFA